MIKDKTPEVRKKESILYIIKCATLSHEKRFLSLKSSLTLYPNDKKKRMQTILFTFDRTQKCKYYHPLEIC